MLRYEDCRCNGDTALLLQIQQISFAMDELRLFIDTHPACEEAISLFNEYAEQRNELVCRYNSDVMPISGYATEQSGKWRWGKAGMLAKGGMK
ncbi:MAG: spore coat protein CotJB [Ruminococcaceae bacterium]|nr:spore coat protein CotJB [Oscillospiraceae bacterium]